MTVLDEVKTADAALESRQQTVVDQPTKKIWDLPVRVFHWTLVSAVIGAFVTNKLGVSYFKYHVWCGYVVLVAVSFRLIWGLVGTHHARFTSFIKGPIATLRYAKGLVRGHAPATAGHNPLGAVMVVALLLGLAALASVGLFSNDEIFNVGPLYGYVSNDFSLILTSFHRRGFYILLLAVVLHVGAVAAHYFLHGENLVKPMITGRKPALFLDAEPEINGSRIVLAVALVAALSAGLAWVILTAPVASASSGEF